MKTTTETGTLKTPPTPRKRGRRKLILKADLFEKFKSIYPDRQPPNNWTTAGKAWNSRVHEGVDPAVILLGVENYAAWIRGKGNEGTEFVKLAGTFLGPDCHWEQFQEPVREAANSVPSEDYETKDYTSGIPEGLR